MPCLLNRTCHYYMPFARQDPIGRDPGCRPQASRCQWTYHRTKCPRSRGGLLLSTLRRGREVASRKRSRWHRLGLWPVPQYRLPYKAFIKCRCRFFASTNNYSAENKVLKLVSVFKQAGPKYYSLHRHKTIK